MDQRLSLVEQELNFVGKTGENITLRTNIKEWSDQFTLSKPDNDDRQNKLLPWVNRRPFSTPSFVDRVKNMWGFDIK